MPLFSILIPIYSVESYIRKCVDSILCQNFGDFELILIDDGSPDLCPRICDEYAVKDSRIRVIHKNNAGLVAARKSGISIAKGQYIINVDGDDYIEDTLLQTLHDIIAVCSPDMIAFDYTDVDESGNKLSVIENEIPTGIYTGLELRNLFINSVYDYNKNDHNTGNIIYSICSKAVKKDVLKIYQEKVPESIRRGEDLAVVMPAITNGVQSLYILHDSLYNYRQRGSSMVHKFLSDDMDRYMELYEYLKKEVMYVPERNINGFLFRASVGNFIGAAKIFSTYREYREYCNGIIKTEVGEIISGFSHKNLMLRRKLRVFATQKHMWRLYWVIYHFM